MDKIHLSDKHIFRNRILQLWVFLLLVGLVLFSPAVKVGAAPLASTDTVTALTTSANPVNYGIPLTIAVSVSGEGVVPTGEVTIYDGSTSLGKIPLTNGAATLVVNNLQGGEHILRATYWGDSACNSSTSQPVKQIVYGNTSTTLTIYPNPAKLGETVNLWAFVAGSGVQPTGTVSFFERPALPLGTANLSNQRALLPINTLGAGDHQVFVVYNGSGKANPSISGETKLTIVGEPTTTSLATSKNPAAYGEQLTFTAQVSTKKGQLTGQVAFKDGETLLSTANLTNGTAVLVTSTLAIGQHKIQAQYLGDHEHNNSASPVIAQQITGNTQTALAALPNPSTISQTVYITATVTSADPQHIPTGQVTFRDGTTAIKVVPLTNRVAAFNTQDLAVGEHRLTAEYSGNNDDQPSVSPVVVQVVRGSPTVTSISSSANPANYTEPVTFTVTVASNAGLPLGEVKLFDAVKQIGSGQLVENNGVATVTFSFSDLAAGVHPIKAVYQGDASHSGSESSVLKQYIIGNTQVSLVISPSPSQFGQEVSLAVQVTNADPNTTPTGSVLFVDTYNDFVYPIGSADLVNGAAVYKLADLPVGTHHIYAAYSGDAASQPGDSPEVKHDVNANPTFTSLAVSANPIQYQQWVTFTAVVTSPQGLPSGVVRFSDGGSTLATVDLVDGTAVFSTNSLAVGQHTIQATYEGDETHNGSTSTPLVVRVIGNTVTALSVSPNPSRAGQNVLLVATVTSGQAGHTPSGQVTFKDGTAVIRILDLVNGSASFTTTDLAVGEHRLTAEYSGDEDDNPSVSPLVVQVVEANPTVTSLASSPNPANYGENVVFTVTVSSSQGTPGGEVRLYDGATQRAAGTLTNGSVAFSLSNLAVGVHPMKAVYAGDITHTGSESPVLEQHIAGNTQATLTADPNPSSFGETVTLAVQVKNADPQVTPTGSVAFMARINETAVYLGSAELQDGKASLQVADLPVGFHKLSALYGGDIHSNPSASPEIDQAVFGVRTITTLDSTPNPSTYTQVVTFTAAVSSLVDWPSGMVTFYDQIKEVGEAELVESGDHLATAVLAVDSLKVGQHSIWAMYSGDATHGSSISNIISQRVVGNTATTLSTTPNPSRYTQAVTIAAQVISAQAGRTPTGQVTFKDGTTPIRIVTLVNGSASFTTADLAVGEHRLVAEYSGDEDDNPSVSPLVVQVVEANPTVTSLASSPNPANYGESVVFTITVSSSQGTPGGEARLYDGATQRAAGTLTNGSVTFSLSNLAAGVHPMKAVYTGDTTHSGSESPVLEQHIAGNTQATLTADPNPSSFGETVTLAVQVKNANPQVTPTGSVAFMARINETAVYLGSAELQDGKASLQVADLPVGFHKLSALYGGDIHSNPSASPEIDQAVFGVRTITTLDSTPNPSTYTQVVTFTAVVSSLVDWPSGMVTFYDQIKEVGEAELVERGDHLAAAVLAIESLKVGQHSIWAMYSGDAIHNSSISNIISQRVVGNTATALSTTPNPSRYTQPVTMAVRVTSAEAGRIPTGQVTIKDGSTPIRILELSGGSASFATSDLMVGEHRLVAEYGGDENNNPSVSPLVMQVVEANPTVTSLASLPNPANYGESVAFTVTVSSSQGTPGGEVRLYDGATPRGAGTLSNGAVTFSLSDLAAGVHPMKAVYAGDTTHSGSESPVLEQHIAGNTQVSLESTPNPSRFGELITLAVQVKNANPQVIPTGSVAFMATINETAVYLGSAELQDGKTSLEVADLPVGLHKLSALYGGDIHSNPSASPEIDQAVFGAATTTALDSTPNPSTYTQVVTFTAVVTSPVDQLSGTVVFYDQLSKIGKVELVDNGSGQSVATLAIDSLKVGQHSIWAMYTGDAIHSGSISPKLTQRVVGNTVTTLSTTPNPSRYTQAVTMTVRVTSAEAGRIPTGQVTIKDGSTPIRILELSGGSASFATSDLMVGEHSLVAEYGGDENNNPSVSPLVVQVVEANPTVTSLVSSPNPANYGESVVFTVTVSSSQGTPGGEVRLYDGATPRATGTLANGIVTFNLSNLAVGVHPMKAVYAGDVTHSGSESPVLEQHIIGNTQVSLESTPNPSRFGELITLAVQVKNADPQVIPTGSVAFMATINETAVYLGSAELQDGKTSLEVADLPVGLHKLSALYGGDVNSNPSASPEIDQAVFGAATTTALDSTPNPSTYTQVVTFTAVVSSLVDQPSGTVVFYDQLSKIGKVELIDNGSGQSVATLAIDSLKVGQHSIWAMYTGDAIHSGSISPKLTQRVVGNTVTTLSTTPNPSRYTQAVTMTVRVTSAEAGHIPTGQVTIKDGSTPIRILELSGGSASFATSDLMVGEHSLTAEYSGDEDDHPSVSPVVVQVVEANPTVTVLVSSANPAEYSHPVVFSVTVSSLEGTPGGEVRLYDNTTQIAAGTLASGTVTFSFSYLAVGVHPMKAVYAGDVTHSGSESPVLEQRINGNTQTTLTNAPNPSRFGQVVTLKANVSHTDPQKKPTGTVLFVDTLDEMAFPLGEIDLVNQEAVLTLDSLPVGQHKIIAMYSGDAQSSPNVSPAVDQVVFGAWTGTSLRSTPNPSAYQQVVTFTATVTSTVGQPSGEVWFEDQNGNLAKVELENGVAVLSTPSLAVGLHLVKAVYQGDGTHSGSSSAELAQRVIGNTQASLSSQPNPSVPNQTVALTAVVSSADPQHTPTGQVKYKDGQITLGIATLSKGSGVYNTPYLKSGSHPLWVTYSGDADDQPCVSPVMVHIVRSTATALIDLTSSQNPSAYLQPVTLNVTVAARANKPAGSAAQPGGVVQLMDGDMMLGAAILMNGQAAFTLDSLAVGQHNLYVIYDGDTTYGSAESPLLVQEVTGNTQTTLTISPSTSLEGTPLTITAQVASTLAGLNLSGEVMFVDSFEGWVTPLGTVPVTAEYATGKAVLVINDLLPGEHHIYAAFTSQYAADASVSGTVDYRVFSLRTYYFPLVRVR